MQFKKIAVLFYFFVLSNIVFSQISSENIHFCSPVEIPIFLSGNFGELRSSHFHAGIDVKTNGIEGKKVFSIDDGFISRIRIAAGGYGKSLYIEHPNGYTSVYAHLSRFNNKVDKLVKNLQYQHQEFEINYFPDRNQLKVKKGDLIGFSGNTGSSSGPHLHFEIRETKRQIPVNPLFFDFNITDQIPPVFYSLSIYPLGESGYVNYADKAINYEVVKKNHFYSVKDTQKIVVAGLVGFGIEINDYLNNSHNPCGIYSLSLFVDSSKIYSHKLDKVSFAETGYIKSHIDYAEKKRSKKTIQKMFIDPNNQLSIYQSVIDRGIYNFNDERKHNISIIATDVYGNTSKLVFEVIGNGILPRPDLRKAANENIMHWEKENIFENNDIKVVIPANALYDTLNFKYQSGETPRHAFSKLHHIHNEYTPLHKNINISLRIENLPETLSEKAFVAQIEKNGNGKKEKIIFCGGEIDEDFITTQTRSFGKYTVLVDTIAPVIEPVSYNGTTIHPDSQLKFLITDELSGIQSFNGFIDNEWALFEYDAKNDLLFYAMDKEKLEKNKQHELELFVIDNKGNIATYYSTFNW
ncbi:MAG: M23 family metallopeptidase [Bacteroidota bacterium]|nr:M23 family metallopeptidase [Bacteroidota bacterium]